MVKKEKAKQEEEIKGSEEEEVKEPEEEPEPVSLVAPEPGVPIEGLTVGQKFQLDGDLFIVKDVEPGMTTAAKLEWAPWAPGQRTESWKRPVAHGTLVVPE